MGELQCMYGMFIFSTCGDPLCHPHPSLQTRTGYLSTPTTRAPRCHLTHPPACLAQKLWGLGFTFLQPHSCAFGSCV